MPHFLAYILNKLTQWTHKVYTQSKREIFILGLCAIDKYSLGRVVIEAAYEAILDAGIHPQSIRETKTGVFVGVCFSEAEQNLVFDPTTSSGFALSG